MDPVPWRRLLAEALEVEPSVVVADVAAGYLGRPPTRPELSAVRRAAHRYAAAGFAEVGRVRVRTAGGDRLMLVLARRDAELPGPRRGAPRSHLQVARGLARTLEGAARAARLVDASRIDAAEAATLAGELERSLGDLLGLRRRLTSRADQVG